jgi:predicted short-subunit dehydrogenase-like oxidoreductase (DUF2520 family)
MIRCAIYGMGKAGRSLGLTLRQQRVELSVCFTRYETKNASLTSQFGGEVSVHNELHGFSAALQAQHVDVLFVAVPDDFIAEVASGLAACEFLPPTVAHLSGARSYDALEALSGRAGLSQFHLLASLGGQEPIPSQTLTGICSSHDSTRQTLSELAKTLDLCPSPIIHGQQALYHAAAVLSGNLSLALVADSIALMEKAGIETVTARQGLAKLLRSAALSLENQPLADAMTGPVARGDVGTLERNLNALQHHSATKRIYIELSARLSQLAKIDSEKKQKIIELLFK